MATWHQIQAQKRQAAYRLRLKELDQERQREADRRASLARPPKPAPPADPTAPSYAEALKASNERVKAGETKHDLQD